MHSRYDYPPMRGLAATFRFFADSLERGAEISQLPSSLPRPEQIAAAMYLIADTMDPTPPDSPALTEEDWEAVFESRAVRQRPTKTLRLPYSFEARIAQRRNPASDDEGDPGEDDSEGERQLDAFRDRQRRRAVSRSPRPRPRR